VGPRPERRIRDALTRFAGVGDLRFIPDDPATLDEAVLTGRPLAEAAPDSQVRHSLLTLASELAGVPAPPTGRRITRGNGAKSNGSRGNAFTGNVFTGNVFRGKGTRRKSA